MKNDTPIYQYTRQIADDHTGMDQTKQDGTKNNKTIRDGLIVIERNGIEYSVDGRRLN